MMSLLLWLKLKVTLFFLGTYHTSQLCIPHIKSRYEETTTTEEEGSGHRGLLQSHRKHFDIGEAKS